MAVADYVTKEDLAEALKDFVTKDELRTMLVEMEVSLINKIRVDNRAQTERILEADEGDSAEASR